MTADELLADIVGRVDTEEVARRMVEAFRAEIDAYRELPEEIVRGQIAEISRHNLELFFATLGEGRAVTDEELGPFRESARNRAAEGLPLEDLLHAYRLGGRLGWDALVEAASEEEQAALLPSVSRLMEYVDRVSDAVTETYHDERRHLMSAEERRVHDLFDDLLAGRPLEGRTRRLAEQAGVALAETYRPFAIRLADAPPHAHSQLAQALRQRGTLAVSEGERAVGVVPADAEAPEPAAPALVALGEPAGGTALADALADARLLLEVAGRRIETGIVTLDGFLAELLLARSPQIAAALERRALGALDDYAQRRSRDLLDTLEVFMAVDLDRRRAAERLHVHPNTLDYRLRRIEELTGLTLARPDDLLLVSLALKQRALRAADA